MKKLLILLLLMLAFPAAGSTSGFSLGQCIELGLQRNPQVEAYRLAVDEAREGVKEAWGAFFPSLSLDAGSTQLVNDGDSGESDIDYVSQDSDSFSVRLSQPLFSGMAGIAGLKKARGSRTYCEYELRYMQLQLVSQIQTSFLDILRAERLVSKWSESVDRLLNQRKIAKAWVEQELATHLRLLEIEVELSNARQQLISAESALAIAQTKLKEWIFMPPEEPLTVSGSLQDSVFEGCGTIETCIQKAMNQRPELQMVALNIEMARQDLKMIRARNLPRLSFDANWIDYERDYDLGDLDDLDRRYYTFSLNLKMQPFQGGKTIFAYRKQKLAIERLTYQQTVQKNTISTEVRTRFQRVAEGESRLESAKKSLAEAQEAYQFADRSTKLGVSSLDDLLTAELRLTRTEINKIDAQHGLLQAQVQLDHVVANHLATADGNQPE